MGGILTQQDAATSAVPTDAAEPSGLVPIAVPPPPPSPSAQPHLLTPSQLMQAAKAALPRSVSGVGRLSCRPSVQYQPIPVQASTFSTCSVPLSLLTQVT